MTDQTYDVDTANRRKMPRMRNGKNISFRFSGFEGYMHVNCFEDTGLPGEIFMDASKLGGTIGSLLDGICVGVSIGLQYGAPLEVYCAKYINWKFEPYGHTDDEEINEVRSIVDYMFRRLAMDYLPEELQKTLLVDVQEDRN